MVDYWNNGQMSKANINTRILLGHKHKSLLPPQQRWIKREQRNNYFFRIINVVPISWTLVS